MQCFLSLFLCVSLLGLTFFGFYNYHFLHDAASRRFGGIWGSPYVNAGFMNILILSRPQIVFSLFHESKVTILLASTKSCLFLNLDLVKRLHSISLLLVQEKDWSTSLKALQFSAFWQQDKVLTYCCLFKVMTYLGD